ncbi:hypothetical protein GQ53DRAFT_781586 [Thozetella sp. PMI_491]|nr:hypothetical protein GQ53DRAFT_781586 [Thozetella sp. PMI_491]
MKYSSFVTLLAVAFSAEAAAVASADPEAWCQIRGQSCWKAKRAAEAFVTALQQGGPLVESREAGFSNAPGGAAYHAKRGVDQLASLVALTQRDATDFYAGLKLDEHFHPDTEEVERHDNDPEKRWCQIRGQSCWKHKRSEAEEHDPEAHESDKRWCQIRGQSCWKAKRAAVAVIEAIDSANEARDVPFDPVAKAKRDANPWCQIRGQSCWKREASADALAEAACNGPDGACTKAARDLHAMYNMARNIVAANTE